MKINCLWLWYKPFDVFLQCSYYFYMEWMFEWRNDSDHFFNLQLKSSASNFVSCSWTFFCGNAADWSQVWIFSHHLIAVRILSISSAGNHIINLSQGFGWWTCEITLQIYEAVDSLGNLFFFVVLGPEGNKLYIPE